MVEYRTPAVVYRSPTEAAYWNGVWTGRLEGVAVAAVAAGAYLKAREMIEGGDEWFENGGGGGEEDERIVFERELAETRTLMRELDREAKATDPLALAIDKPKDGEYTGESAEDDEGDQAVQTTLTFGRDGRITGEGYDGVDGAYTIREGRWSAKRVAWIEEYHEGFTVALRGQVRPDGTIVALWASSVGVGGSVSLEAPVA